ncbi:MAG: hypothetical protein ABIP92_09155 [Arthrobacter sp.]
MGAVGQRRRVLEDVMALVVDDAGPADALARLLAFPAQQEEEPRPEAVAHARRRRIGAGEEPAAVDAPDTTTATPSHSTAEDSATPAADDDSPRN